MMNFLTTEFSPAKRVAAGKVWGRSNHQIPPTGFIPTPLDTTGNKTYSNGFERKVFAGSRNSAKQVPQVEGLPKPGAGAATTAAAIM